MQTNNKLREALMQIYDRVNSLDEDCGVGWVVVKIVSEVAGCEDDPEALFPEAEKPEVVSAGYHANAGLHPPCRT